MIIYDKVYLIHRLILQNFYITYEPVTLKKKLFITFHISFLLFKNRNTKLIKYHDYHALLKLQVLLKLAFSFTGKLLLIENNIIGIYYQFNSFQANNILTYLFNLILPCCFKLRIFKQNIQQSQFNLYHVNYFSLSIIIKLLTLKKKHGYCFTPNFFQKFIIGPTLTNLNYITFFNTYVTEYEPIW